MQNFGPVPLNGHDLALFKASLKLYPNSPDVPALLSTLNAYIENPRCSPDELYDVAQLLNQMITTLCPEHRHGQGAQDPHKRLLAGHLMLMGAIFALNTAKAVILFSIIQKKQDAATMARLSELHGLCYSLNEECEYYYKDVIETNSELKALKERYFNVWFNHNNNAQIFDRVTVTDLEKLIHRKNARQAESGGHYYGELIYNAQSCLLVAFDEVVFNQLIEKCQRIQQGEQRRTQFMVYIHGRAGHVLAFDISVNPITRQLQIICLESACEAKQYDYLQKLTQQLSALKVDYQILACQLNVQKDAANCAFFAFVASGIVAQTTFEQLKQSPTDQPTFWSHFMGARNCPTLLNTSWFHVTALGEKAILLCQSSQAMADNLKLIGKAPGSVVSTMQDWTRWYGLDFDKQKTYINYRIEMMRLKLKGDALAPLSLENILTKIDTKDPFVALRRLSAGRGSKRLLEKLLMIFKQNGTTLDSPHAENGNTAAHFSVIYNQPKRAILLFNYGASFAKPNKKGESAQKLYQASSYPLLLENAVLREKLKH